MWLHMLVLVLFRGNNFFGLELDFSCVRVEVFPILDFVDFVPHGTFSWHMDIELGAAELFAKFKKRLLLFRGVGSSTMDSSRLSMAQCLTGVAVVLLCISMCVACGAVHIVA